MHQNDTLLDAVLVLVRAKGNLGKTVNAYRASSGGAQINYSSSDERPAIIYSYYY
jgi:hypothetical protein